ncbi:MAG TPA: peptidylprolyl isomerase, partial [Pyrinomonadaceae bacterium]
IALVQQETFADIKEMAEFALGEIESLHGADALIIVLENNKESGSVRARAVEALGKIAASLPNEEEKQKQSLNAALLNALKFEAGRRSAPDEQTILLAITATLRAKVTDAGPVIAQFLTYSNPRVRADAANALSRLRLKNGADGLREMVAKDSDAIVRANAARALGAAEDKQSFDVLLDRALNDSDLRVRVSAIRALASLKDGRLTQPLLKRAKLLEKTDLKNRPTEANELLEIAVTLGRVLPGTENLDAITWLRSIRPGFSYTAPELEIAFARISPRGYLQDLGAELAPEKRAQKLLPVQWKKASSLAQGLGEIAAAPATLKDRELLVTQAESLLREMLNYRNGGLKNKTLLAVHAQYALPDILRALAAFKPKDLCPVLRNELNADDVIVRATAADLLGELPPEESNATALIAALPAALNDVMNDAALSILDSLSKQKTAAANDALKRALDSSDHLVRRRAVALLKANSLGDFSSRIGIVKTLNTQADYKRALDRANHPAHAQIATSKGSFVIELLSNDAPLTVDNFVRLATRGYFNGQAIPRVVPNFVVQAGDPRGDQNGGPGYTIRCEINEVPYDRGAVGMALSGKDTGGSQWFVTHSPQPHLDGGYTVFGRVISGMEVVDALVRGDILRSVTIIERSPTKPRK